MLVSDRQYRWPAIGLLIRPSRFNLYQLHTIFCTYIFLGIYKILLLCILFQTLSYEVHLCRFPPRHMTLYHTPQGLAFLNQSLTGTMKAFYISNEGAMDNTDVILSRPCIQIEYFSVSIVQYRACVSIATTTYIQPQCATRVSFMWYRGFPRIGSVQALQTLLSYSVYYAARRVVIICVEPPF